MDLKPYIRDIPDFPKPGIVFKDIAPLLGNPDAFATVTDTLAAKFQSAKLDYIAGIESRGFIFGAALANALKVGFIPLRKPGKLPYKTIRREYSLEYGTDAIEVHEDALQSGKRVLLVDDLLATGGTAAAASALLREIGADLVGVAFVVELAFLQGRTKLKEEKVFSLLIY